MSEYRIVRGAAMLACALVMGAVADVAAQGPPARAAQAPVRVHQTFSPVAQRTPVTDGGRAFAVAFSTYNTEGWSSVIDETWQPGFVLAPKFHKVHAETFYVVAGRVEWTVGGQTKILGVDDCVHIPPFTAFSARVVDGAPAKLVRIYQPGGYEVTQEAVRGLTPAQQRDPKIASVIAVVTDLYDPSAGMPKVLDRPYTKYFDLRATRESHEDDGTSDVAVSSIDSGGRLSLQEEYWQPNFFAGMHFHNTKTETFYVLGGRVEWTVGGETHVMTAGDAVHIPANTPHTTRELDGKKLHTLLIYQSYGYDTRLQLRDSLTPDQQRDPAIQQLMRAITDFNPIGR